ncbi:UNVERIFIED_CONTAM: hypothetical protein Slati_2387800 [Sesamum latifolium]|uniref:Uncharacterized protein n=1 Tax=Sesamum latifolium TaxID=2727402 RepID=A0AAW2WBP5_9LAMI
MTERFCTMRKVAPRAAGYQGQYFSCKWVIEVSTLRPRDPTHGTCYRVQAVHAGPLAKMSDRGTPPHCGHITKLCRKTRKHAGHAVWDHCEMSAYRMGLGFKMRSYSDDARKTATTKAWADRYPE